MATIGRQLMIVRIYENVSPDAEPTMGDRSVTVALPCPPVVDDIILDPFQGCWRVDERYLIAQPDLFDDVELSVIATFLDDRAEVPSPS